MELRTNHKEIIDLESIEDDIVTGTPNRDYVKLCDSNTLRKTLNPLFLSMRILGSIHGDIFQASCVKTNSVGHSNETELDHDFIQKPTGKECCLRKCWHALSLVYSLFAPLMFLFAIAHGIWEMYSSPRLLDLMTRVFLLSWVTLCLCQHVLCVFLTSYRNKRNPLNRFDKFVKAMILVRSDSVSKTRDHVISNLRFGWIYMLSNAAVIYVGSFYPEQQTRISVREIFLGKSNWTIAHSAELTYSYTVVTIYLAGDWAIPTCFYISLCLVVGGCFDDLHERAVFDLKNNRINLEDLRREYVRLCNVLAALNDLLSPLGMIMFSIYIPLICLNLNVCIQTFRHDLLISQVTYIAWILLNCTILLAISIYGAYVNESASRLSMVLHNINAKELDRKGELELMLLLNNLNTNYACLTVGGLVTVDKGMIITIFGTIVGYLTILIQFH